MLEDKVTVVIAVKDGARFIEDAVLSALALGSTVARIIVVDDGSLDDTRGEVKKICDHRLTLIDNPGVGVSAARNAGAAIANTRWLNFLDADDRLAPGGLDALLHEIVAVDGAVMAYGNYERIGDGGESLGNPLLTRLARRFLARSREKPSGFILEELIRGNFLINGGIAIVAKAEFDRVGGFDESLALCEDWRLWCRLAASGPVVFAPVKVMDYRVHFCSVMMSGLRRIEDFQPALEAVYKDPCVTAQFSKEELSQSRRAAESSLIDYCAAQAARGGRKIDAVHMAVDAIRADPGRSIKVVFRVASAAAGL